MRRSIWAQALVCGSTALTERRKPTGRSRARSYSSNASNGLDRITPPKSQNTAVMSDVTITARVEITEGGAPLPEDCGGGVDVVCVEREVGEHLRVELSGGGFDGLATARRDLGEHAAPSVGFGLRCTSPAASSRSTALVTLAGWTCRRSPILPSGSAPRAGEAQQHEHLEAGKGETERAQQLVDRLRAAPAGRA